GETPTPRDHRPLKAQYITRHESIDQGCFFITCTACFRATFGFPAFSAAHAQRFNCSTTGSGTRLLKGHCSGRGIPRRSYASETICSLQRHCFSALVFATDSKC